MVLGLDSGEWSLTHEWSCQFLSQYIEFKYSSVPRWLGSVISIPLLSQQDSYNLHCYSSSWISQFFGRYILKQWFHYPCHGSNLWAMPWVEHRSEVTWQEDPCHSWFRHFHLVVDLCCFQFITSHFDMRNRHCPIRISFGAWPNIAWPNRLTDLIT